MRQRCFVLLLLALSTVSCGGSRIEIGAFRLTDPRSVTIRGVSTEPRRLIFEVVVNRPTPQLEYFLEEGGRRVTEIGRSAAAQTGAPNTLVLDMVRPDRTPLPKGRFVLVVRGWTTDGRAHGGSQKSVDYDGP